MVMEPFIVETSIKAHHRDFLHPVHILNSTSNSPRHSLEEDDREYVGHDRLYEDVEGIQSFWEHISINIKPPLFDAACIDCTCTTTNSTSLTAVRSHTRQRSLTDASCSSTDDEMTSLASEAPPGSPPGLSASKSSKSSSYHSSSHSGVDGIISDISHFEDIGLDEVTHLFVPLPNGMDKLSRPPPRTSATTTNGHRGNAAAMTTIRELTNVGGRSPPLKTSKSHTPTHSLSLPNNPGLLRRGYRNASTPSLAITAMSNYNRSRSPSPNPGSPLHKPPPSPISARRPGLAPIDIHHPPKRRTSWQPSRKSIKELEAEYTENDGDDDLPEDASLWNVPLSPRPPTDRLPLSASSSPKPSPCASPERLSPLRKSLSVERSDTPGAASRGPDTSPNLGPPTSPRHHKLVRGASTGAMPDRYGFPHGRAKSWNVVLSELSEDAKALTETLESHAFETERKQEEGIQNGSVSPEPGKEKVTRSKTSPVELPPLRLNNVMIDPLPISKEKERVLTRTRPSWLPPKSQKEEKKHLKEYQRMMEMSREAEKRKAAKAVNVQCRKENRKSALLHIWEEHVLPNWDQVIREPRTRELWWRGVAPKSRGQVWQRAIGNELALTDVTCTKALNRAKDIEGRISGGKGEDYQLEKKWFDAIHRDVKVTFPELNIFQAGGPLHDGLVDVLMAYSMYRSDVGYSHGTHLIAALLLLTLPNFTSTFITLANLLNRPLPLAFLTGDPANTQKAYDLTLSLLAVKHPRLHAHLFGPASPSPSSPLMTTTTTTTSAAPTSPPSFPPEDTSNTNRPSLNLPPHTLLEPMLRTLFLNFGSDGGLGVDTAARVWDVMVFDGDTALIRTAVAVLGALEGKLYGDVESVLGVLGWGGSYSKEVGNGVSVGGEEEFMARVRAVGREGR